MTDFNLYGRTAIQIEHLLNDHRQRAREVLAPAADYQLIEFIDALRSGEGWERFIKPDDPPFDAKRFLELLAIPTVMDELKRRVEAAEL
jgi:hypothetical protein